MEINLKNLIYRVAVTVTAAPGKNATSIKGNDKDGKTMDVGKTTYWNVFLDPQKLVS